MLHMEGVSVPITIKDLTLTWHVRIFWGRSFPQVSDIRNVPFDIRNVSTGVWDVRDIRKHTWTQKSKTPPNPRGKSWVPETSPAAFRSIGVCHTGTLYLVDTCGMLDL